MEPPRMRIESFCGTTRVFIDGKELEYVTALDFTALPNKVPIAKVELYCPDFEFVGDGEVEINDKSRKC